MSSRIRVALLTVFCASALLSAGCPGNNGLDPNQFSSCDALMNYPTVQAAIKTLTDAGKTFTFVAGSTPPVINGTWQITLATVTQNQDGPATGTLPGGKDIFAEQTPADTIAWMASREGGVSAEGLRGYINGTGSTFSVCLFAKIRTANPITGLTSCETQNAIFYTLTISADGQSLSGSFLAVNLASIVGSCGAPGDFDFGTIQFTKVDTDTPRLEVLGSVPIGLYDPTSIVMHPNGTHGYVGTTGGQLIRFNVASLSASAAPMPTPNAFAGLGTLGMSAAGSNVGFATLGDNRFLGFNTTNGGSILEGQVLPPTVPSPATFLPSAPVYNAVADAAYIPTAFQNQRPALSMANPRQGGNPIAVTGTISFTQDSLGLIRMRPDFGQIAAVLKGSAPGTGARFLGFVDTIANKLSKEVDVTSPTFLDFREDQVVYAADGTRVFLTNGQKVVVVGSSGSFGINTSADLRENGADEARLLATSNDNKVLAIALIATGTRANFVLLNPQTLVEIHRSRETGAAIKGAGAYMAFFPGTRIVAIEDGTGNVTPINTESPYFAGDTLHGYASPATANIAGIAIGDRILAVANRSERTVYLYRLKNP